MNHFISDISYTPSNAPSTSREQSTSCNADREHSKEPDGRPLLRACDKGTGISIPRYAPLSLPLLFSSSVLIRVHPWPNRICFSTFSAGQRPAPTVPSAFICVHLWLHSVFFLPPRRTLFSHHDRLNIHQLLQAVGRELPPDARLLHAAEGQPGVGFHEVVDGDGPGIDPPGQPLGSLLIGGGMLGAPWLAGAIAGSGGAASGGELMR